MKPTTNILCVVAHRSLLLALALMTITFGANAQSVAVSETNTPPDPSAMLDVQSLTKGMLIPRMTEAQRVAIAAPANALIVYQTQNTTNSLRGFWYYDATIPQWVHLGRGETSGVIQQPSTVVTTSHNPILTSVEPGRSQITWFPPLPSVPTIMVTPEFTVVGVPPQMDDYCVTDLATCADPVRILNFHLGFPADEFIPSLTAPNNSIMAHIRHGGCPAQITNPNHKMYRHLPWDGNDYVNAQTDFNKVVFDLCNHAPEFGLFIQPHQGGNRSISVWIDANQDGDFNDPGELLVTYDQISGNTGPGLIRYVFGSHPSVVTQSNPPLPPIPLPIGILNSGDTKMRFMIRLNNPPITNPCFPGDANTVIYDIDVKVLCGGAGAPFFPNDLNWCNVDEVTTSGTQISCFDNNGTPTDMRFHYKVIEHD